MLLIKQELDPIVAKSYTAAKKEIDEKRAKGLPVDITEIVERNTTLIVDNNATAEYKEAQNTLKQLTTKYKLKYSESAYKTTDFDKRDMKNLMSEEDRRAIKNAIGKINSHNNDQKNKGSFQ